MGHLKKVFFVNKSLRIDINNSLFADLVKVEINMGEMICNWPGGICLDWFGCIWQMGNCANI